MQTNCVRTPLSVTVLAIACMSAVHAQSDYPNRPIRYIVPYPAGGSTTFTARLVGSRYTEAWGQQIVIDNRPGANTMIGTQLLVRARADGYTIGYIGPGIASSHLLLKPPYDGLRDIAPIASIAAVENLLVVHPSVQATTLREFVALAKSRPGQLDFATSSMGGSTHFAARLLNSVARIETRQIPYKGAGPAIADLMGGQVHFMLAIPTNVIGQVQTGRLRAIAVTGESRLSALPHIPTFTEAGVPGISLKTWHGVGAPAGTPKPLVAKLSAEIGRLIALPETRELLASRGFDPFYNDPEQTAAMLRAELMKFEKLIREAQIKPE
jgi:tripartite-type tricarboxylate transporter receptor subunit TctC